MRNQEFLWRIMSAMANGKDFGIHKAKASKVPECGTEACLAKYVM